MIKLHPRDEYLNRLKWLIVGRLVFMLGLLAVLAFFQQRYSIYSFHPRALFAIGILVLSLSALYWYLLHEGRNLSLLAYLQTFVDLCLVTYFLYLTGGIDSGYGILYHLTIITATIVLYRRGGYLTASGASILYGTLLDMQYYSLVGLSRSQNFTEAEVLYHITVNILLFYVIAFLSGYLADRLRKTRLELQEKSTDFEDLRALQQHILQNVGSGIVTMDMEGRITSWNPAAEAITGYRYEEIIDRWQDVFGACAKSIFGHSDELRVRPFNFNGQVLSREGRRLSLNMTASLLRDELGDVRGIILIFQDISRMVEMEEQVRRQDRLATIGSLAAGIAHEIRNPLASLSGSIQVLKAELALQGDHKRLMDIVIRETDRLNTIITEFLEYARPRTAAREPIALAPLLDETVMLIMNSRDFNETISVENTCGRHLTVLGDAQRLKQVFWNLLINACQAMPRGGVIRVHSETVPVSGPGEDRVSVTVSDTGTGIGPDHLDKIFDPFFTTKSDGTGLGLAIVNRIITDHNGTIDVESAPGKGTRVRISLPAAEVPVSTFTATRQTLP